MSADVITNLYGGLGNQLFQFAATLNVIRKLNLSTYELLLLEGHRDGPVIGDFTDVNMRLPTRSDRARWTEFAQDRSPLNRLFRQTSRLYEQRTARTLISQTAPFDGVPDLSGATSVKLEGFFQNPEWFSDTWSEVVLHLTKRAPSIYPDLVSERRSVVHFRRGDYVRSRWDLPPSYYLDAAEALNLRGSEVVVVGDEPGFVPWLAEVLRPLGCVVAAPRLLTGVPVVDDFWNVAAGAQIILANSTYSWWAAAVATARGDGVQIAYPRPWIVNRWSPGSIPDFGLAGWAPFRSGLPDHTP